jgi:hypothetical protein
LADVHRDPADVVVEQLNFPGMDTARILISEA